MAEQQANARWFITTARNYIPGFPFAIAYRNDEPAADEIVITHAASRAYADQIVAEHNERIAAPIAALEDTPRRSAAEAAAYRGIPTDKLTDGLVGEFRDALQPFADLNFPGGVDMAEHVIMREWWEAARALLAKLESEPE